MIPPDCGGAWVHLATWEIWMGMLVCLVGGFGVLLIASASDRVVAVSDFSRCYGPPPIPIPCEQTLYRGGLLYAAFSALSGVMLIGVALWFLWEVWSAAEPRPIADDFLRLLHDSFARRWLDPRTWPWARMGWAFGFTAVGIAVSAGLGTLLWTVVASWQPERTPVVNVETSQSFRLGD